MTLGPLSDYRFQVTYVLTKRKHSTFSTAQKMPFLRRFGDSDGIGFGIPGVELVAIRGVKIKLG